MDEFLCSGFSKSLESREMQLFPRVALKKKKATSNFLEGLRLQSCPFWWTLKFSILSGGERQQRERQKGKEEKRGKMASFIRTLGSTWLLSDKEMANIPELLLQYSYWKPLWKTLASQRRERLVGIFCSLYGKVGRLLLLSIVRIEPPLELATPRQNFHFGL